MTGFLRFFGIVNAAVWFGAALFFTFAVAPVFFLPATKQVLGEAQAGIVAMMVLDRYFTLHCACALVALLHQVAEWVYLGKAMLRSTMIVLLCLLGFGLLAQFWVQPRMQRWHEIKYAYSRAEQGFVRNDAVTPGQRARAARSFGLWHGVSQSVNLLMLGGVAFFLWRATHPVEPTRFLSARQFRS